MVLAQDLAGNIQGLLEQGLGALRTALPVQVKAEVTIGGSGLGVVLAQDLAGNIQGLLEQGLGRYVPALPVQVRGQLQ